MRNKHLQSCYRNEKMMYLRVLLLLVCLTGVLLMLFAPKKICFSSSDSYQLFINNKSWNEIGNETFIYPSLWVNSRNKVCTPSYRHKSLLCMMWLLCGDIESLPGPVRHNSRRDSSLLTCRGLKLFHQNERGLHAKRNLITVFLRGRDIDFLTLSETHTQNTDNFEIFSIPGYHYIGKSRTAGTGGGVGLYISNKQDFVRRKDLELTEIESIWIEIRIKKSKNILLCATYRPLDSSLHLTDNSAYIISKFSNTLSTASKENIEIILTGDLNFNYLNNTDHREIKDIFLLHGLTQIIKSPTRYDLHHNSSSLIDVVFVKQTSRIAKSEVLPTSISDHDMIMIGCVYQMNNIKFNGRTIYCRDYRNYDPEQLQKDIRESSLSQFENIKSANDASLFFKFTLIDIFQKHAPEFDKKSQVNLAPGLHGI